MASLSVYSDALDARVQGAAVGIDSSGNVQAFAGTATKLSRLTGQQIAWTDVSGDTYSTLSTDFWRFGQFGERVMATNYRDPIQSYVMGTSTDFADLSSDAPKAKYLATVKDFVFAGNTNDATDGVKNQRVWWPKINDPTTWPTPGTSTAIADQSDFQDLPGNHGEITGLVGNLGSADAAIFLERAVFRVFYTGSPNIFAFQAAEGLRGCPAPNSIVQLGNVVYYLGEDGFYAFDGTTSIPIGAQKIDKTFWADLDQSVPERVVGAIDPISRVVFWAYPGQNNSSGNPNRILSYNWVIGRWSISEVECELIARILSFGYTLDDLSFLTTTDVSSEALATGDGTTSAFSGTLTDTPIKPQSITVTGDSITATDSTGKWNSSSLSGTGISSGSVNYETGEWSLSYSAAVGSAQVISADYTYGTQSLDALPASLDSRLWTGGKVLMAGFDSDHKLAFFTGTNLAPTVETTEVELFPSESRGGAQLALVTNSRPAVDGGSPSVAIATRNRLEDVPAYGTTVALNSIGDCPQRICGRYVRASVTLPAASSFTHIQGVDLSAVPNGKR